MNSDDKVVILKLKKITVISLIFMLVQLVGGYYAHSIAIFADAFHLLSDVLAYVISLFAVLMSYKTSPKYLTFGYEKLQPLGALINVGIIWIVTAELFIEATHRLLHKQVVEEPTYMLATSIFGLLCNLFILNILHTDEHAEGHHNCSHSHHHHNPTDQSEIRKAHNQGHSHSGHKSCSHSHHSHEQKHDHHAHAHHSHHDHVHSGHNHEVCKHSHHKHEDNKKSDECGTPSSINAQALSTRQCFHSQKGELEFNSPLEQLHVPSLRSDEQMHEKKFNNINMEAAYIHILTDIILSIGVIVSASIIYFFAPDGHIWSYWQIADPMCTYLFSFLAIYSTIPIIKQSLILLLDGCNSPQMIEDIQNELKNCESVRRVDSLRVWSTNRGKVYGSLRVVANKGDIFQIKRIFSSRKIEGYVEINEQEVLTQ